VRRQHTDGHDLRDYGNENTVILRGDDEITGRLPAYRLKIRLRALARAEDANKIASVIDPYLLRGRVFSGIRERDLVIAISSAVSHSELRASVIIAPRRCASGIAARTLPAFSRY